jgi:3-oxoacyl-[acyl-carrier protein] reductase
MRLKDLSIVITGRDGGGRSIADCCTEEGARVVINDINSSDLREAQIALESRESQLSQLRWISPTIGSEINPGYSQGFGRIDVLVNNAGIMKPVPFWNSEKDWDEAMRVNLKGAFNCARYAAQHMVQQREAGL